MPKIRDWLNDRTGYRAAIQSRGMRTLRSGPSWGATLGPCLLMLGAVELVTGLVLMTTFSPATTSAWASVHFIESQPLGSFLRGMHYWGGQVMCVLLALYMLRALLLATFRAPREIAWFTGLLLLPLLVVWTLTGGLVNGSQTAYGQIEVESNILGQVPLVGPVLRTILLGGNSIGNLANTHLYALHVGLLPLLVGGLTLLHVWQCRRLTANSRTEKPNEEEATYWPHQSIRNLVLFVIVLAGIAHMAWHYGAPRDMPADTSFAHIARPEWYFTFLFELRHLFSGPWEVVLTMAVPMALLALFFLLPTIDRWLPKKVSATLRVVLAIVSVGGWAWLTFASYSADQRDAEFAASRLQQEKWTRRANLLADHNAVPPEGAISLLRNDAKTQGSILFTKHCASCHSHAGTDNANAVGSIIAEEVTAPNLYGFASRDWIAGFMNLERISSEHYYGNTVFMEGEMVEWVRENIAEMQEDMDEEEIAEFQKELADAAIALSAEAQLPMQKILDEQDAERIALGKTAMAESLNCIECHRLEHGAKMDTAPDLAGYGSRKWLIEFISNPQHGRFYPKTNDRMPAFAPEGEPNPKLELREIELIADWLRGDWFEPVK